MLSAPRPAAFNVGANPRVSNCLMLRENTGAAAMADFWIWWILAALLVGLELATGTFYLLALGVAFGLGGIAAWLGASPTMQMIIGGALAAVVLVIARYWRKRATAVTLMRPLGRGLAFAVHKGN